MMYRHDNDGLTLMDWFCGAGGSSQGAHAVPGVRVELAANHWARAIESHSLNFPDTDHYQGDIRDADVTRWPAADLFWASPECPQWSNARGKKRDFSNSLQTELFGPEKDEAVERSRALMEEVPLYLRAAQGRGHTVLAGVVENVVDVRGWDQWDRWLGEIRGLGYSTRLIALSSMHAQPRSVLAAPQSRDRLYVAYWHRSLGRTPDWDKWLRPTAWCPTCERVVRAVQVFKKTGADMGRYRQQYVYRCPHVACRNSVVEPMRTLTTAGHQSLVTWQHLLVPYYGTGTARTVREPIGTLSTRDRYALVKGSVDVDDVLFRMLEPHEIGRAMSFADGYRVVGNKRERVRQYGNAVTPNSAEVIVAALVEAITGQELSRHEQASGWAEVA